MSRVVVFDACALIAYVRNETGADVVDHLLGNPDTVCYAHAVNLCEVHYHSVRAADEVTAKQVMLDLYADGVTERRDMSRRFWTQAGRLKAGGKISLADCFCVALALHLGGEVVTSDHGEFDPLAAAGVVPIHFIR